MTSEESVWNENKPWKAESEASNSNVASQSGNPAVDILSNTAAKLGSTSTTPERSKSASSKMNPDGSEVLLSK